jgi:hypothetical protein
VCADERGENGATISPDGKYRYRLWRTLPKGTGTIAYVMLNPSTADHQVNDPTIRKCLGFAERWGAAQIQVVNLFAYRATDPRELLRADRPTGPENTDHVLEVVDSAEMVVCAWGAIHKELAWRAAEVVREIRQRVQPWCLGYTKDRQHPRHPLMLAYSTPFEWFKP